MRRYVLGLMLAIAIDVRVEKVIHLASVGLEFDW
jgi:hypothetical protein